MAAVTPHLTIAPFLQGYDPATGRLTVHVTLAPVGDPRAALTDGFTAAVPPGPAFAGATIVLRAHASGDPSVVPTLADVPALPEDLTLGMPAQQADLFDALAARYQITKPQGAPVRNPGLTLRKYLPESYRAAFAFVAPRTELAVTDDSYECARSCPPPTPPVVTPPDESISWGEAFAALMRQPAAARAAGLIHTVEVDAAPFADGGFLFLSLAPGSDFAAQHAAAPEFVDVFATRVPRLVAAEPRAVFTPVLFPVAADAATSAALGSFDDAFAEALRFDDGFTRIVHCNQPTTADPNVEPTAAGSAPVTDYGLQIGWDDEDIAISLNRALSPSEPGKPPLAVAPPGFSGWRVDARPLGAANWSSLCRIRGDGIVLGVDIDPFEDELAVEVQPSRLGEGMWLRPYHARWRARSLVAPTTAESLLAGRRDPAPVPYEAVGLGDVALRYGRAYEVRVRMRDVTGGGPGAGAKAFHAGEAGSATWRMRRFVPLGQV
nr:hypothetical protein [Acidimicrobiia bacterium]